MPKSNTVRENISLKITYYNFFSFCIQTYSYLVMISARWLLRISFLTKNTNGSLSRPHLNICAISDNDRYDRFIGKFWSDVYGYKMNCMRQPILEEASVEIIPGRAVVSDCPSVLNLDINTCSIEDTQFSSNFNLVISQDCELTGLCGYFDIFFVKILQ